MHQAGDQAVLPPTLSIRPHLLGLVGSSLLAPVWCRQRGDQVFRIRESSVFPGVDVVDL